MRKGCDKEKRKKNSKIAVHYRRASQPPEQRLTGMPTACANRHTVSTCLYNLESRLNSRLPFSGCDSSGSVYSRPPLLRCDMSKKCRKAECAAKCLQVVGSSLFFGHFFSSSFFSFISCLSSLKWVMHDGFNYPSPHAHSYILTV